MRQTCILGLPGLILSRLMVNKDDLFLVYLSLFALNLGQYLRYPIRSDHIYALLKTLYNL